MVWEWPGSFFRNFVPALVRDGHLTAAEEHAFQQEWSARSNDPATFFSTPPLFDIIGAKPS